MQCDGVEAAILIEVQGTIGDAAEAVCLLQDSVKHRRKIARRAVDDLKDLGGRGLLFERLARLGDEPRILDGDHSLVGKAFHQCDLAVAESANRVTVDHKHAEELVTRRRAGPP